MCANTLSLDEYTELADSDLRDMGRSYAKLSPLISEFTALHNAHLLATKSQDITAINVSRKEFSAFAFENFPHILNLLSETALFMDGYRLKKIAVRRKRDEIIQRFKKEKVQEMMHPSDAMHGPDKAQNFKLSKDEEDALAWFESPALESLMNQVHLYTVEAKRIKTKEARDERESRRAKRRPSARNDE